MRKAILATLVTLAAVALLPATASAQASATGQMVLDIDLPNLVILYYYSDVTVTIDATNLVPGGSQDISTTNGSGTGFSPDLALAVPALDTGGLDLADVSLTLTNAWAVRALAQNGNVAVTFNATTPTLDNATSGSIGINTVTLDSANATSPGSSGDPVATPASITFPSPGLGSPEMGDLGMTLNMSAATSSGSYTGTFVITATTL